MMMMMMMMMMKTSLYNICSCMMFGFETMNHVLPPTPLWCFEFGESFGKESYLRGAPFKFV